MKKTLLLLVSFLMVSILQAQFSIPAPTDAAALAKLKSSEALAGELKQQGLTQNDVIIKLEKKEAKFLESDEVCYRMYRDSKKIEGSNYLFSYSIVAKQSKPGEKLSTKAYVWYTRVDITKTTCNIENVWTYEFSQVDPFSLETKNGLLSVDDAEKLIMDTLNKGLDLDKNNHNPAEYGKIRTGIEEICRIDGLKTCEFGKANCAQRYEVKNEMYGQKHIMCFEVELYRAVYETGDVLYGSMRGLRKFKCLLYAEFERKGAKVMITTIYLSELSNDVVMENKDIKKPYDVFYVPLSKTKVQNIRNKFEEGTPDPKSIRYYMNDFKDMASDLNQNLGKNYEANMKVLTKYFTEADAMEAAKKYAKSVNDGYKYDKWQANFNEEEMIIKLSVKRQLKKYNPNETGITITPEDVKLVNGKYLIKGLNWN